MRSQTCNPPPPDQSRKDCGEARMGDTSKSAKLHKGENQPSNDKSQRERTHMGPMGSGKIGDGNMIGQCEKPLTHRALYL